jgi:hypothetical protein
MLASMLRQILTLHLDGVTAADYLAHLCDPEPPALGSALRSVAVRAAPLGDTVEATLEWARRPPAAPAAARAAGLPLVAEVARLDAVVVQALAAGGCPASIGVAA